MVWHQLTSDEVLAQVVSTPQGLAGEEAARRLAEYGPNELQALRRPSPWTIFLAQFKNVLIIILLAATGISAFLGHGVEAAAIAVIVLFAVMLGFIQEWRAERAIEALNRMAAPTATVLRDNDEVVVAARELVPGDVILLHAGDKVPADARLLEAINLQTEEAALTGESLPVEKQSAPLGHGEVALGDRRNMVYCGTAATYGRGRAVVVATGMDSEFGRIARMLESVGSGRTPLQENLDRVGRVLAVAALAIVAVIVVFGLLHGQGVLDMLLFGIALAVAVVPEALPAVVTISLGIGVQRMVRRNALMRRLPAVETLGSISVICSDKTGTLTRDEMTVRRIFVAGELLEVSGAGYEPRGGFSRQGKQIDPPEALRRVLRAAALACDAKLTRSDDGRWQIHGDPTEGALVVAAAKAAIDKFGLDVSYPRVAEIPFTSEAKRMITLHTTPAGVEACAKGAPEVLLECCSRQLGEAGEEDLGAEGRAAILEVARAMAEQALRVLAVASKPGATLQNAEQGLTFLGLVGMIDPPRPEARAAVETCTRAGIRPLMITGDHPVTARAVARELGILDSGRVVTGAELDGMDDARFAKEVERIEVYARVSPVHKLRVVETLQRKGHVVAMTGDGVNDAPALKKADIGIAMGITGTDVTREAAAMTLTDDNFASIVAAVEEGRRIFANIKKYLMYLLSSNIGEIGLIAAATLAGLPLPLSTVQILYVNLATDGLPALALAIDPPEPDLMRRPPRNPRTGIFSRPVVTLMLVGGLWSALVNFGLFVWGLRHCRCVEEAMTMTFVSLVLIQFFKAYNFRSDRRSLLHRPFANRWLNLAVLWELVLLGLIVYLPPLHKPFSTFSLPAVDLAIVAAVSFSICPVLEIVKWLERRGWFAAKA